MNSLRLKPGIIIVAVSWLIRFGLPVVWFQATPAATFAGALGWLGVLIWWTFLSRASRLDRLGGGAAMIVVMALTPLFLHESVGKAMNGIIFFYVTPILSLTFVLGTALTRSLHDTPRRVAMLAVIVLTCGAWTLVRFDGMIYGDGAEFAWRWTQTTEERLLAKGESSANASVQVELTDEAEWPGFRGPNRNSVISGVEIETDWTSSPPTEIWRREVGPGWSSFSVRGNVFYTQEQRGEEEVVVCYDLTTGEPVWQHANRTRFWEAIGGPGPRATPTIHGNRVYAFGANGTLNALDAGTGSEIWSRNVAGDVQRDVPMWGFSSSPLIVGEQVIVAAAGTLAAYSLASGDLLWKDRGTDGGYSSPHLVDLAGTSQLLLNTSTGVVSVVPETGEMIWKHEWEGDGIVQPAVSNDDLYLGSNAQSARIAVSSESGKWTTEEKWSSNGLKPYFNDFVIHRGHADGFDGRHLACIDVETGKRKWKGGRYGAGQLILLEDADLLLVSSEKGELGLVSASPEGFSELARVDALKGKTWNHPVLVNDIILVRNGAEMAAYRVTLKTSA